MSAFQNIAWILFAYQVKALPEIAVRLLVVLASTDIFLAKSLSETREVFHLRVITKRLLLVITAENTLL